MKHYLFIAIILMTHSAHSQEWHSQIWKVDFKEASPLYAIELDKTPQTRQKFYASNFSNGIEAVRNQLNTIAIEKALTSYLQTVENKLSNNAGILLKFRLSVNEFGNNILPPNFLLPIGVGMDPVDAYSEFLNASSIIQGDPSTTNEDASFYLWISKEYDELTVSNIAREFNEDLIKQSNLMAIKKAIDKTYTYKPLKYIIIPDYVSKAVFWNKQLATHTDSLNKNRSFAAVQDLTSEFNKLQVELTNYVREYDQLKTKETNNNSFLSTVEIALKIGTFILDQSNYNRDEFPKVNYDPQIIESQNKFIREETKNIKKNIDEKSKEIKKIDNQLINLYRLM